jgi:hypothetical protein
MITRKRLARAYYRVTLRPNTRAADVAVDLVWRMGDESRPMCVLAVWSEVGEGPNVLGALVRYEARGANANDVWRRVCGATPLVKSQVEVIELASFNMDEDLGALDNEFAALRVTTQSRLWNIEHEMRARSIDNGVAARPVLGAVT